MTPAARQHGMVLLLVILIMLAIGGVAILGTIGAGAGSALRSQQKLTTNAEVMAAARAALIGYAVNGTPGLGNRPGQLPTPDTLQNTNYNGLADATSCLNGAVANGLPALSGVPAQVASLQCIGRLPWKQLGLAIDGASEQDVLGIVPWYAVSQNLADPNPAAACMSILNPRTAASSTTTFSCAATTGPAWPWLKVCDATGNLLSDRVAFVLIIPGELLQTTGRTQARIVAATGTNPQGYGQPGDFLDAIPTPSGWAALPASQRCTGYDNAALTGEYVTAPVSASFNDQLIFVTIDELMPEVERRVTNEIREALTTFRSSYAGYPWLTPITNPMLTSTSFVGQSSTTAGLIPFHDYSNNSNRFMTELSWAIGGLATGDTGPFTGNLGNAETQFSCGGGVNAVCTCRARIATSAAAIPRTLTSAAFGTFKAGTVAIPAVSCKRNASTTRPTRDATLDCDIYTMVSSTTPVTYAIQRRDNSFGGDCIATGTRVNIGNFAGTTTRSVAINLASFTGTATTQPGSATTHARRSVTNSNINTIAMVEVSDRWVPTANGAVPFNLFAATFPNGMQTGYGQTAQTTSATLSNIRLHADVPVWYASQKWYESTIAAFSNDVSPVTNSPACSSNCFSAGTKTGVDAVVISAGPPLAGQNRFAVTPAIGDFLEAPNVTGASTRIYASSTQPRNTTYADTVATIPK